jgi:hypothetical protein
MDWIGLAQEESFCESNNEPSVSEKFWKVVEWLHIWWPLG